MAPARPRSLLLAGLAAALLAPLVPSGAAAQEAPPTTPPTASPTASPSYEPRPFDPTPAPATASPSPAPATTAPTAAETTPPGPTPAPTAVPSDPVLRVGVSALLVRGTAPLTVSGRYYTAPNAPAVGVDLDVLGRVPGATGWARLARVRTDSTGLAVFRFVPRVTREYAVRTTVAPALTSESRTAQVQPLLTAALTPRVGPAGRTAVLTGTLTPAYLGTAVLVQRRTGGGWATIATVRPSSTGAYRAALPAERLGLFSYRTHLRAAPAHRSATSAPVERVVEGGTLRQGDRGTDVRVLQQRLAAAAVDVGPVDGVFGYDLRHAVTAFQKSQGLPRTGVYDAATRARLANPRPVVLRYPSSGRAVEVDLDKQVLYLSERGKVTRIVDVSTGNDELYTVDGVTSRAFTPTGRFRVERKIDGVRVSRLGELYRPAYFVRGWAVHGSPNVPVYPDSHGCVRVTNGAMDRLYGLLTVGTPVAVYR